MTYRLFVTLAVLAGCSSEPDLEVVDLTDVEPRDSVEVEPEGRVSVDPESAVERDSVLEDDAPGDSTGDATGDEPSVLLDGDGLRLLSPSTRTTLLPFGDDLEDVVAAVARVHRPAYSDGPTPYIGPEADCSAGPLDAASWPDGFTVFGRDGVFVGWSVVDTQNVLSTLTTMGGLGLGTTLADLEAGPTTVEFGEFGEAPAATFETAGIRGMSGGGDPDAVVVYLWAGAVCAYQ